MAFVKIIKAAIRIMFREETELIINELNEALAA